MSPRGSLDNLDNSKVFLLSEFETYKLQAPQNIEKIIMSAKLHDLGTKSTMSLIYNVLSLCTTEQRHDEVFPIVTLNDIRKRVAFQLRIHMIII